MQRSDSVLIILSLALATMMSASAQEARRSPAPRAVAPVEASIRVTTVATGLEHPWGLAFLPDGRMLVTERTGRLRLVAPNGQVSPPIRGIPRVFASGQGGLLDVVLAPKFESNRLVYFSYAEPGENGTAGTAAARGRLNETATALEGVAVIWRQRPKVGGSNHFGGRLVFAPDGTLFITTGERYKFQPAQDLASGLGKIVRINPDGSIPRDNPFVDRANTQPEVWSYGHRNVQGAAIHPETGVLWTNEFGPFGGDELNISKAGRNYGWPLVSWGRNYDGTAIPHPPTRPELADAIYYWVPVISPSGMIFYTGEAFPDWRGDLLIGGLSSQALVRLTLDGQRVTDERRIDMGARIRDVNQGQDGFLYLLTDDPDGAILRLEPADGSYRRAGRMDG
ncbi:MAG TPA: PQQ-dependent sugar dehydrogenase [Thiobacillaceae bacterium]|nr:PQQ-dependent sugar dehydrogenase [Thiobacillaceae bacterium]